MTCIHGNDAGAYLLRALPDEDAAAFSRHLMTCESCQLEVDTLQSVVDTLPMAAPQTSPGPALKSRIMNIVESEAALLRATGPEADRVTPAEPKRRRRLSIAGLSLRPATAGVLASALIAVGVAGGIALDGGSSPSAKSEVYNAKVTASGARASLTVTDGKHGSLHVVNLPSAPSGKVYQVWLQAADQPPVPTHTLFNVRKSDGSAIVPIEESVTGAQHVLVTPEPDGGSQTPTGPIVIDARQNI